MNDSNWNATAFFEDLTKRNRLAQANGFRFCRVSGLDGFEEALQTMQSTTAFVCVSDLSQGFTALNNTPRTRRVKTIFLAMRCAIDDMPQRQQCLETMQELFRQFMSVLIQEDVRLREQFIYLDPRARKAPHARRISPLRTKLKCCGLFAFKSTTFAKSC